MNRWVIEFQTNDPQVCGQTVEVRPEVAKFAIEMERVLKLNDFKGGWKKEQDSIDPQSVVNGGNTVQFFRSKLQEEHFEVITELFREELRPAAILRECADVANIAMMIADNWGGLLK